MRLFALMVVFFLMTAQAFAQDDYTYQAPLPSIGGTMQQQGGRTLGGGGGNEQAYFLQDCQKQFQSQPFLKLMGALLPPEKIRAYCACNYNGLAQRGLMAQYWDYNSLTASGQVQAAYSHSARPAIEAVTQACGPALQ
jgi:hypothetical protein